MAQSFIDALAGDFNPEDFTDSYREALEALVQSKAEGVPLAEEPEVPKEAEVVDLVAALRASVEAAKKPSERSSPPMFALFLSASEGARRGFRAVLCERYRAIQRR